MKPARRAQLEKLGHGRNKYGAVKVRLDGFTFDSKREAAVYMQLKLLQGAGKIARLARQVPFVLTANGEPIGKYKADFVFDDLEEGRKRVVDVKGFMTPLAQWKLKHMKAEHGVEVEIWR